MKKMTEKPAHHVIPIHFNVDSVDSNITVHDSGAQSYEATAPRKNITKKCRPFIYKNDTHTILQIPDNVEMSIGHKISSTRSANGEK